MIKRRLIPALLSIGLAGGLIFSLVGLNVHSSNRTDIVSAAGLPGGGRSFVGPADDAFFVDL